ncbi:histidine phosphatase family protein [Chthonobacter rhizosphaerae]|uniref:histidine phosphatase family protein n=1 Tax=Chthonobacter rhizosphaerae TaxID=2735553 RepID=UPI0015EED139|nr:histidine phosphatase family protein [Chthonobacter rhizosphaerae]
MIPLAVPHDLIVIRHGQTAWNATGRLQGREDVPLDDMGREQARRHGRMLKARFAALGHDPDGYDWIASPLVRATETMRLAREEAGLDPLAFRTDERLVELDFGTWSGLTLTEILERDPDGYAARRADRWNRPPTGGETSEAALARLAPVIEALSRPTVLVIHGGLNRLLKVLIGALTAEESIGFQTPQDRFYVWSGGTVEWI